MSTQPISRWHPAVIWSTWFWTGLAPKAPGTVGSLAALPVGFGLYALFGPEVLALATAGVFLTGCWSCRVYMDRTGKSDPKEVVIDEVAGQWIVLLVAGDNLILIGAAFVLFRIFDIWKPWPIRWLDQNLKGAFGVMIDDVAAGIFAAVLLFIVLQLDLFAF